MISKLKKILLIYFSLQFSLHVSATEIQYTQLLNSVKESNGSTIDSIIIKIENYHNKNLESNNKTDLAHSYYLLGYAYSETNYQLAEKYLLKAVTLGKKIQDSNLIAQSHFHLGLVKRHTFRNEEALNSLHIALNYFLNNNRLNDIANTFSKIGLVYDNINDTTNALYYFNKSLNYYKGIKNNIECAKLNHSIGVVYSRANKPDKALSYYTQSMLYFEKDDYLPGIAAITNNMGVLYDKRGDKEKALKQYIKAFELYNEIKSTRAIVISAFNIGETYKNLNEYDKAIPYFEKSLALAQQNKISDYISYNYIELSETFESLNDYQTALTYHKLYFNQEDSLYKVENNSNFENTESKIKSDITIKELALKTQKLNRKTLALYVFIFGAFLFLIVTVLLYIEKRKNVKAQKELLIHKENLEELVKKKTMELELEISERKVAEESDKLKSAFLANMSHEIRTPMNSIISFSRYLRDPKLDSEKRGEYINYIISCGRNLMQLINDILDITKIDAYKLNIHRAPCNLTSILNETYEIFRESKAKKLKNLEFQLGGYYLNDNIMIDTDHNRLKQVLTNLLENAFKFTSQGKIEFGIEKIKYNLVFFYVKDSGTGIPLNKSKKIFERFQQAEMSLDKKSRGAGLGLAICRNLTALLGGKIWLESAPERGSIFRFTIPVVTPEIKYKNNLKHRVRTRIIPEYSWQGKNILIAEDEELNYKVLQIALNKSKANIYRAKNGKEAIEFCTKNPVDLILMDIQMPEIDGYMATRIIKDSKPDIPIIAQTSFAMNEDKQKCYNAGCDDFITKPIDVNGLLLKIDRQLKVNTY